jgi:hypothetical protein
VRLKIIAEAGDHFVGEGPDGTLYGRFENVDTKKTTWVPIQGWSITHVPGELDKLTYGETQAAAHLVSNV